MSNELFNRKASFTFGLPGKLGKSFDGFRIKFKIIKTSDSSPNKSNIQIYNMTKETRALTEKKGLVFILKAGYETSEEKIFSGDVARAITELDGPDYVTTFEAGDGEKAFQTARLEKSFQEGSDIKDIFAEVIGSLGQTIKDVTSIKSQKINNGVTLSGLSRNHMNELAEKHGLEWSIQDGGVQVLEKNKSTKETAILLNSNTGLIGVPKKKEDGSIDVVSLLQPKIKPGRLIKIESNFLTGEYVCRKVTHVGDTHGQEWYSQIEAVKK